MYLVFWCLLRERETTNHTNNHGGGSTLSVTVRSFWVTNKSTLVCLSLDRIPILFPLCVPVIIQSLFYFLSQRYYFSHQWTSPIQPAYSDKQIRRRGDTPHRDVKISLWCYKTFCVVPESTVVMIHSGTMYQYQYQIKATRGNQS
ncbi:hypothetical protein L873DRAFT_473436 [Choiromyces venosus 120613-1]|uniref:Uncharacterized protein n=1 Tax=Choiromyces venosus 120613-1 TaxID=1336337 RepID=A0A3N4IWJ9_9PEZI|nr:hypothetical protein L873DRAFT_473436 [Choiromyces venosus 120613-1]